ncbi:MAG: hypothetical protein JNL88_00070 [Bacteroidia bacterium]|nr:hypothetical protein [Bacteroidia bacterium]
MKDTGISPGYLEGIGTGAGKIDFAVKGVAVGLPHAQITGSAVLYTY